MNVKKAVSGGVLSRPSLSGFHGVQMTQLQMEWMNIFLFLCENELIEPQDHNIVINQWNMHGTSQHSLNLTGNPGGTCESAQVDSLRTENLLTS